MKVLNDSKLPSLPFVVCNTVGEILRTGECPGHMVDIQARGNEIVFVGKADQNTQMIDLEHGQVIDKPTPQLTEETQP